LNEDESKAKVWYELNNPTFIKQNRPGESKRSRRARAEKKKAREETIQREEERREQARLATTGMQSLPVSSPPIRSYRLGKRNQKYVVIHNPVKSTPRTHNYRRKVQVTKQKVINHYKNKASSHGRKTPFYRLCSSTKGRSLKFKRRLYNKICQSRKVVRPAPTVRYEESRRGEIRFDETDADWDVLNEAIAIAKREAVAVKIELMATKAREDEEETAPSDKFDPVKEALDFLAVNGIAGETPDDHVEQIRSQPYRRPVPPATLTTGLCHIIAFIGASNIKSKRRIKNMRRRMLLNIKIRPRCSRIAITSYYTAKVENILSKYMYNQRLRVQSILEERVRSDEEKGGDDTLDTLSCTSSSSNTEDSIDDINAIDSKVSSSGCDNDSKKKTAPNQEEQAAPMPTNVDLSVPGAFTQYFCNSKRCCSDAPPSLPSAISTCSGGKMRIKCPRWRIVSRFIVYQPKKQFLHKFSANSNQAPGWAGQDAHFYLLKGYVYCRRGEVSLDPTSSYVETLGYAFRSAREILNVPRYMSGLIGPPEARCLVYHGTYFLDMKVPFDSKRFQIET